MRIVLLTLLLSGCIGSFEERMAVMKEMNPQGCSYLYGGGTPPGARLDGGVIGAWGEVDITKCPEIFKALK